MAENKPIEHLAIKDDPAIQVTTAIGPTIEANLMQTAFGQSSIADMTSASTEGLIETNNGIDTNGDIDMGDMGVTPPKATMAKDKNDWEFVPTDEQIAQINNEATLKEQDPKFWTLDAAAWIKTRTIFQKLLEPKQASPMAQPVYEPPSAKEIYNIIADNLPWDASHERFDVSKIWLCWHPDKIRGRWKGHVQPGEPINETDISEMMRLSSQVFANCNTELRMLFPLAEKMKNEGLSFGAGYASDDESEVGSELDEPPPDPCDATLVQGFHKYFYQKMEEWIIREYVHIKKLPQDKQAIWQAGQKSKARQTLDKYNDRISQENMKMSLKPGLGVVPLEILADRWKNGEADDEDPEGPSDLLQLWARFQFPLGWTHMPPLSGNWIFPNADIIKAEYRFRLNQDPDSGTRLPVEKAGWPAWQEVRWKIQIDEKKMGIQSKEPDSDEEGDDLRSYLSHAGYDDDEWRTKEAEWFDFATSLRKGIPTRNPFETGPQHPRDPTKPSLRSRSRMNWENYVKLNSTDNGENVEDLVMKTRDLVLHDSSHQRVRRLLSSQRTSCGQIQPNHTIMGDPIVAFHKKLTTDEMLEDGRAIQMYSYQYVVDKGNGIKELVAESECGGRAVRSKLDETAIPRISEAFHTKKLPRQDVLHAIECGVNWVTQPRVPHSNTPKKSPSAVVELYWKAKNASTGLVTEQTVPLWKSHFLSIMGVALGDKLCADSLSTGTRQFKTWWEVLRYMYPYITPPGSALLTLPAPRQLLLKNGTEKRQPQGQRKQPQTSNTRNRNRRSGNSMNTSSSL